MSLLPSSQYQLYSTIRLLELKDKTSVENEVWGSSGKMMRVHQRIPIYFIQRNSLTLLFLFRSKPDIKMEPSSGRPVDYQVCVGVCVYVVVSQPWTVYAALHVWNYVKNVASMLAQSML